MNQRKQDKQQSQSSNIKTIKRIPNSSLLVTTDKRNVRAESIKINDFSTTPNDTTTYVDGFEHMLLTTLDNPFSPFDDYERWNWFDVFQGYNTNQLVSRLTGETSDFVETKLGAEFEDRFYYSTLVDIVRNSLNIPYVIADPQDYDNTGRYKYYTPSIKTVS